MSPATKSKSKDKSSAKAVKEQKQKAASKLLAAPANGGNSAYNPISGTFYTLETVSPAPSPASHNNSRLRVSDDQSGSSNGTPEYDSMSNNDSCSGESEDQKEKGVTTSRLEAVPGSDTDKREKIRQKNERKHQRQKERRTQELHERCNRCLMSRKLEALSRQLVAMGFPSDRATMALLVNGGRLEESVAWLFEGGEGEQCTSIDVESNLKIDISDELAKIVEMEIKFKCSKQDVERAIVACDGDMEKAAETLIEQKQEPPAAPSKSELASELSIASGVNKAAISSQTTVTRTQVKSVNSSTPSQQKRDERDFNYTKTVVTGTLLPDSGGNRNLQPPRRPQPKGEWTRLQEAAVADKRWPNASSSASVSYSMSSPLQVAVPPAKTEARYAVVGSEAKTSLQTGTLREPVIVMQRPQSNARQSPPSTSIVGLNVPPAVTSGWYPNGVSNIEMMKPTRGLGPNLQGMSLSTGNPSSTLQYRQNQYQHFVSSSLDTPTAGLGGRWNAGTSLGTASASSSLAVPSSLGLFTGWGSYGSSGFSSPVDWTSTGSLMMQCDYTSIDWSLDSTPLRPKLGRSVKNDRVYDAWAATLMEAKLGRPGINGGVCIAGLQDSGIAMDPSPSAGSPEWTSPFAGKDLFSLSRQFVTSPSLRELQGMKFERNGLDKVVG